MAAFVFTLLISAMASSLFWLRLSKWVGKFYAWQTFNFVNAMTNLAFFAIGEGDNWLIVGAGALNGVPIGGQFLVNTIMADVIDYDEFLNGSRCEAAFSVFATLIPKVHCFPFSLKFSVGMQVAHFSSCHWLVLESISTLAGTCMHVQRTQLPHGAMTALLAVAGSATYSYKHAFACSLWRFLRARSPWQSSICSASARL